MLFLYNILTSFNPLCTVSKVAMAAIPSQDFLVLYFKCHSQVKPHCQENEHAVTCRRVSSDRYSLPVGCLIKTISCLTLSPSGIT